MSKRSYVAVLMASLFAIVSAVLMGHPRTPPVQAPVVISGADLGFRVDGHEGGRPVGTLVVRVNGRWVEPKAVMQPVPLGR
jgi:hypothetical protein